MCFASNSANPVKFSDSLLRIARSALFGSNGYRASNESTHFTLYLLSTKANSEIIITASIEITILLSKIPFSIMKIAAAATEIKPRERRISD